MNFNGLKQTLNDKQYQAVCLEKNKNALILAGAGSGKTHIITHRIAYLHNEYDIDLHQILAVTFTNKAAREIKNRLQLLLQKPVGTMWIGTFHSIAYRILQENTNKIKFQVIDKQDQLVIIKQIIKNMYLDEKSYIPQKICHLINQKKNDGIKPSNINDKNRGVYTEYETYCNKNNLLDFAEILLKSCAILQNDNETRVRYQNNLTLF